MFQTGVQSNHRNNNTLYTEKYQDHIPFFFAYTVVYVDDKLSKPAVLYRRKKCSQ